MELYMLFSQLTLWYVVLSNKMMDWDPGCEPAKWRTPSSGGEVVSSSVAELTLNSQPL